MRRNQLEFTGLDLFIPSAHFVETGRVDRAVASTLAAIELAASLGGSVRGIANADSAPGRPSVGVTLPAKLTGEIAAALRSSCERWGVALADYQWPIPKGEAGGFAHDHSIGVGLDPATVLAAGEDPASVASRLAPVLACARLSDSSKDLGSARVAPGSASGKLDLTGYGVALATGGYRGTVVLDLRGVPRQAEALRIAMSAWSPEP